MNKINHPNFSTFETERKQFFAVLTKAEGARKVFLQALITPEEKVDGASLVLFNVHRKPSDEEDDWRALGIDSVVASGTRLQYLVDRYDGPRGSGFILGAQVEYQKRTWRYCEHHGPEKRSGPFDGWEEVFEQMD